jgi:biotin operon repressor
MKKIFPYLATVVGVFLFVILVNSDIVKAIDSFPKGPHHKIMEQLTEEQQKEVKAKMQDLWDSGASREEIHTEVTTMLNNFGIEIPEDFKGFRGKRGHRHGRGFMNFSDQLSEEQREAIKDKVEALREEGVSREEIHKEVTNMLQEYGIKIPEAFKGSRGKRGHRPGRGFMHFSDELNDEQREAILEKAKSMHEQGASREEIHAEIGNMLKDFGIDLPEEVGKHREMMENLDDEQRKVIRAKMREMRKEGASREEIREEMNKMFRDFDPNKSDDQINQSLETSGETLSIRSYPNPFNPETNIEYQIKSATEILITIYDVQGKRVKSLADDYRQAGTYTIKWNGLNESGIQVPSGVYFIRISAGNEILNHRIVMMK